ncbi:MAG: hypothetical protein HQ521_15255 [Bacteroidetes bacterium]|nr:hypothetical protein [Bacteroidota bacterium]
MTQSIKATKILTLTLFIIGLYSCSPEKKLAIEFASKAKSNSILILVPNQLFKVNLKTFLLDSLGIKDDKNKDSLLLIHSHYLSELNDSLFIANYILGYAKSLTKFGFRIYNQSQMEEFLAIDSNTYQINIAQIELEETLYTYRDEANVIDSYYYHDHNLNAVYVNSWFEISNLDENDSMQKIYFSTDLITDIPEGAFDYDIFSGKVRYMYNIDSLELNMLYDFAYQLGSEYAKYTFDLLLNEELDKKIDASQRNNKYWRYDPTRHTFFLATDDRFIPLDE